MVCYFWTLIILITCFEWELVTLLVCFQKKCDLQVMGVMKLHFNEVVELRLIRKYIAINSVNLLYHISKVVIPAVDDSQSMELMLGYLVYINIVYLGLLAVFGIYSLR